MFYEDTSPPHLPTPMLITPLHYKKYNQKLHLEYYHGMMKLLVVLFIMKLIAQINIFKLPPPFFKFYSTPALTSLFLLPCYFGWMCDHANFLNNIMDLDLPSHGTVVPSPPSVWFMQHGIKFTEGSLIWNHTQDIQGPIDWFTHINIYQYHMLWAHSSYLYYTEWTTYWYKNLLYRGPQCLYFW